MRIPLSVRRVAKMLAEGCWGKRREERKVGTHIIRSHIRGAYLDGWEAGYVYAQTDGVVAQKENETDCGDCNGTGTVTMRCCDCGKELSVADVRANPEAEAC
jgi:hypothetical protein